MSTDRLLPEDSPARIFYEYVRKAFGSDETMVVALSADDVFTHDVLSRIATMVERLARVDGVHHVTAITNVANVKGTEDGIDVRPFVSEIPTDPAALAALRREALANPIYAGNLVSKDGKTAAIVVGFLDFTDKDFIAKGINKQIDQIAREVAGPVQVYVTGGPHMKVAQVHYLLEGSKRSIPLLIAAIALVLTLSFRTVRGVLLPLTAVVGRADLDHGHRGLARQRAHDHHPARAADADDPGRRVLGAPGLGVLRRAARGPHGLVRARGLARDEGLVHGGGADRAHHRGGLLLRGADADRGDPGLRLHGGGRRAVHAGRLAHAHAGAAHRAAQAAPPRPLGGDRRGEPVRPADAPAGRVRPAQQTGRVRVLDGRDGRLGAGGHAAQGRQRQPALPAGARARAARLRRGEREARRRERVPGGDPGRLAGHVQAAREPARARGARGVAPGAAGDRRHHGARRLREADEPRVPRERPRVPGRAADRAARGPAPVPGRQRRARRLHRRDATS